MIPRTHRQGRRPWWFLLALGVLALVGGGIPLFAQTAAGGDPGDAGSVPRERVAGVQPYGSAAGLSPPAARTSSGGRAAAGATPPVHLTLPRLGVDAPVLPVSVGADGLLNVPDNPRQLGWWRGGGTPGMPSGSVVIDGHVDSATLGLGALFRLREARPGDQVVLTNAAQEPIHYTVVARRRYAKTSLPVAEVFAQDVAPRLVLITCGGRFDQESRHYADNIVVYAVPS